MRKRFSKSGERLYRVVKFKVFSPGNGTHQVFKVEAPNGAGYPQEAIDKMLVEWGGKVEEMYPDNEYRLVETGPASFNFVWECGRTAAIAEALRPFEEAAASAEDEQPAESAAV